MRLNYLMYFILYIIYDLKNKGYHQFNIITIPKYLYYKRILNKSFI